MRSLLSLTVLPALAALGACVMIGLAPASRADSFPPGTPQEWSKYFPGQPVIPDPEVNLYQLIPAPETRCVAIQQQILADTIQYGRDAFNNNNSKSQKDYEEIEKVLQGLDSSPNGPGDDCFDSVTRTYLAASLHLLDPNNSNVGEVYDNPRIDGRPFPLSLELTLLGTAIIDHKLSDGTPAVGFLTPTVRAQSASPVWNQRTGSGKNAGYLVSAGYDCTHQSILIDPYLPPLNLGATFVHELDHLFRDRLGFPESEMDISSQLTMDETLATVTSAYYQKHMQWFHNLKQSGIGAFFGISHSPLPFSLKDDLTLFNTSNKGALNEIWNLLDKDDNTPTKGLGYNPDALLFLEDTFLRQNASQLPIQFPATTAQAQEIYQTIYQGYFNGGTLSASDVSALDPSLHGAQDDPLAEWLNDHTVSTDSDDELWVGVGGSSYFKPNPSVDWIWDVPADQDEDGQQHPNSTVQIAMNLELVFQGLDQAFTQLFGTTDPSPYCSEYLSGLRNGELSSYVGGSLSQGVKPGETGVKPGETGVKPGETGVKPDLFRPCLNIGPEL